MEAKWSAIRLPVCHLQAFLRQSGLREPLGPKPLGPKPLGHEPLREPLGPCHTKITPQPTFQIQRYNSV